METCKHGSGAGSRKPTAEMRQGAECRAYYIQINEYYTLNKLTYKSCSIKINL